MNVKVNQFKKDITKNIIATLLPVFTIQFIVLPIVSRLYNDNQYGLLLTTIGLISVIVQPLSVSLTNTRLIMNNEYKENNIVGDYNLLLTYYQFILVLSISIGITIYNNTLNITNVILVLLVSFFQLFRRYFQVYFRINNNYSRILISNSILSVGYLIGTLVFLQSGYWQLIYLFGELAGLVYILINNPFVYEKLKKTILFSITTKHAMIILVSSLLGSLVIYIDRLLLYSLIGPRMVAVYYVSTLFGKTLSLLIGPISNVILTYLSKMKYLGNNLFKSMFSISFIIGIISYFLVIIISKYFLYYFYPQYSNEALNYIHITTATAVFTMISSVLNPIIMKFRKISWQIVINIITVIVYITLAFILLPKYNLFGFCYAALLSQIIRLIIIILIYLKKNNNALLVS